MPGGVDWGAPPTDIFQPPDSTAQGAEDQDVDVSTTELPRLSLLRGIECGGSGRRILKVLDLGVNPNYGLDHVPLWRGIASVRVSTSDPISLAFMILSFHCTHNLAQSLICGHDEPRDVDSPSDAVKWEVRHASSKETRVREERERDQCVAGWVTKMRGMEASPRSASSGVGEWKEGQLLLPSLPCTTPSPHREVVPL
jgi:hypothetical protein